VDDGGGVVGLDGAAEGLAVAEGFTMSSAAEDGRLLVCTRSG
jgi:hypothetical protein